ncbi:MAG: TetR/AcrR family transcriptional regulator [Hyphomonadaceae bacterium]|nr:TetR/AcrR family transcriptional regulator [Hyphomonadaceae bacterium]
MTELEKLTQDPEKARDRGVARRQAFLRAAREVFFEAGYEAASVNDVVARAGGSLATLYSQFGSKEGLFLAVVRDQFERLRQDISAEAVQHLPLEEGLVRLGEQVLQVMLQPDYLAFNRLLVNEGRKFPDLVRRMAEGESEETRFGIECYLHERSTAEGRPIADPKDAAQYFVSLLRTRHLFNAITDPAYTLTPEQLQAHVQATVNLFLHGVLPPRGV